MGYSQKVPKKSTNIIAKKRVKSKKCPKVLQLGPSLLAFVAFMLGTIVSEPAFLHICNHPHINLILVLSECLSLKDD